MYREAGLANTDNYTVTHKGIELVQFRVQRKLLRSGDENPDNKAYHMKYSAMINISSCTPCMCRVVVVDSCSSASFASDNVPIFISPRHMLWVPDLIINKTIG